jgi:hypothetical protein
VRGRPQADRVRDDVRSQRRGKLDGQLAGAADDAQTTIQPRTRSMVPRGAAIDGQPAQFLDEPAHFGVVLRDEASPLPSLYACFSYTGAEGRYRVRIE